MGIFSPELFEFLAELADHNDRPWFEANRHRYEDHVKQACFTFVEEVAGPLAGLSTRFEAVPRIQGGSVFRIHRDTRFTKDPAPYRTSAAMRIGISGVGDVHTAGLYLSLEPGRSTTGAGFWKPSSGVAQRVRANIDARPDQWSGAVAALPPGWELMRVDSLVRAPKDYPADHPFVDDLRLKSFVASGSLDDAAVLGDHFPETWIGMVERAIPLLVFLCDAVDVDL
jgi:uncharacterized protein (TIGR02453 family)